jgi:hypothetical protein
MVCQGARRHRRLAVAGAPGQQKNTWRIFGSQPAVNLSEQSLAASKVAHVVGDEVSRVND